MVQTLKDGQELKPATVLKLKESNAKELVSMMLTT